MTYNSDLRNRLSISQLRLTRSLNDPTNQLIALSIFKSGFQQYLLNVVVEEIGKVLEDWNTYLGKSSSDYALELVFIKVQKRIYNTFPEILPEMQDLIPETDWLIKRLCFLEGPLFGHLIHHLMVQPVTPVASHLFGVIVDHLALKLGDLIGYYVLLQPSLNQKILKVPKTELVFLGEELSRLQIRLYWLSYFRTIISHPRNVYYSSHPVLYVADITVKTRLIHYPRFSERSTLSGLQRFVIIYLELYQLLQLQMSSFNSKRKSI
nr:hypothetical protein [Proteomonas sp. NIES-1005]